MWKSLKPGDRVEPGDIIRHISALSKSAFGERDYEVVKAELHYFEIAQKPESAHLPDPVGERKIIKYIDIGYHLLVEVWLDTFKHSSSAYNM
jgi:hypothetical protein